MVAERGETHEQERLVIRPRGFRSIEANVEQQRPHEQRVNSVNPGIGRPLYHPHHKLVAVIEHEHGAEHNQSRVDRRRHRRLHNTDIQEKRRNQEYMKKIQENRRIHSTKGRKQN